MHRLTPPMQPLVREGRLPASHSRSTGLTLDGVMQFLRSRASGVDCETGKDLFSRVV